jgi:Family of unknown function (DUF5681)
MKPPKVPDYPVGYGKPPPNQWKKGETGNPMRKHPRPIESELEMIDRLLMAPTKLTFKGKKQSMTKLEALALRVSNIEIGGNPSATRLRIRLEKLERSTLADGAELQFEENEYTRNLASPNDWEEET